MSFLIERDYKPSIRKSIRTIITGDDSDSQKDAEETAIEIVSTYLRSKYDVSKVFKSVDKFATGQQWSLGDLVYNSDKVYTALIDDPGDDLSDTDKWSKSDPRNRAIIMVVIDIALYYLHSNISPQNIPELRVKRYDDAISWLTKIQKELLIVELPLLDDTVVSNTYTLGSRKKVSDRW